MNSRRRAILAALAPVTEFALERARASVRASGARDPHSVPGLTLRPRADANTPAELLIYGAIGGGGWFSEGISAADVAALLRDAGPGPVNARINSGGGDVFDGIAIHTLLSRHPGQVTTYNDGIAASAASVILMAGQHIVSARNAFTMIHDAMTYTYGNADTHGRAGDLLTLASDNIADLYAERAGEDAAYWRDLMTVNGEDGTWYTGSDALAAGLVDEITQVPDEDDAAAVGARLAGWVDVIPARLHASIKIPPAPDAQESKPLAMQWNARQFIDTVKGAFL